MDRVNVSEGPNFVGEPNNGLHIIDGAHGVRCVSDGDNLSSGIDLARQVFHVQRAIFFADVGELDLDTTFFEGTPGRDIGIVVKMRKQDFVTWTELSADCTAYGERQGGHVWAEDDFVRIATKKIR